MRVMTEKVQALYEKANEGRSDGTPEICGYYGRACRQMGTTPSHAPCMRCPLAKFLDEAKRIIPQGGGRLREPQRLALPVRGLPHRGGPG